MSSVKSIRVEILAGNCGGATSDEVARYALCVEVKLEEFYPGADVTVGVSNGAGYGGGATVNGSKWGDTADFVNRVVQDVWEEGAFWSPSDEV